LTSAGHKAVVLKTVQIRQAKAHFSALVAAAGKGKPPVVIALLEKQAPRKTGIALLRRFR
jgi:antitoxin (DNA-binding transcriptional repressor) of toxin-antitoxin stability system